MGRTVLIPTMVAAASRAPHVLLALSLAVLLALTLAAPVAAQEETTNQERTAAKEKDASGHQYELVQGDAQQAEDETQTDDERTADPLEGQTANITADSIGPIAVAGCEAATGETASITVTDENSEAEQTFVDNEGVVFQFEEQGITVNAEEGETDFTEMFDATTGNITGKVVRSEGIACDDADEQRVADDEEEAAPADDATRTADELGSLSCDELLVLFRAESGSGQQYGDAAVFADSGVRAQVEVCLKEEIVKGTAANEALPDTGGLSLLALAVLGVVSAAAGLSVLRGGQR